MYKPHYLPCTYVLGMPSFHWKAWPKGDFRLNGQPALTAKKRWQKGWPFKRGALYINENTNKSINTVL